MLLGVACTVSPATAQLPQCQHVGGSAPNDALTPQLQRELVAVRAGVWRAFFTADTTALVRLLPAQMTAMPQNRAEIITDAQAYARSGGTFGGIDFFDDRFFVQNGVAIIWSRYVLRLSGKNGETHNETGCAIELFVKRDGRWINPHWHLDRQ